MRRAGERFARMAICEEMAEDARARQWQQEVRIECRAGSRGTLQAVSALGAVPINPVDRYALNHSEESNLAAMYHPSQSK